MIMYGEEIKYIKEGHSAASVIFCVGWGGGSQKHKNQFRYGSLSWITALCHQYVVTLPLISAPRHKTTHCTAEARFAVPFPNQWRTLL